MPDKNDKIGALWQKETKNGDEYFSGVCEDEKIVVFRNNYKEKEQQPDFIIYRARWQDRDTSRRDE